VRAARPRLHALAVPWLAALLAAGCASAPKRSAKAISPDPVSRQFLSGDADDWEPSLAVGGDDSVHIIATRKGLPLSLSKQPFSIQAVTWSSKDGGKTFDAPVQPTAKWDGHGDSRIKSDRQGNVYASWIGFSWDPASGKPDMTTGGLILATSRDLGRTFQAKVVATLASGVSDKPELEVSPDGRDIYIVFDSGSGLALVASHDGGETFERHAVDPTKGRQYWPTGIGLAPDGSLFVTVPLFEGPPPTEKGSDRRIPLRILRSADRGVTWQDHIFSDSTVWLERGWCAHGPTCPVAVPYAGVAVDGRNRVYVAYTEGTGKQPPDLRFQRSEDGGVSWSAPQVLSAAARPVSGDQASHFYPMIAASGDGLVYVVWIDDRAGPVNVWAKRSSDGGRTWSPEVRLSRTDRDGIAGFYGEYGGLGIDSRGVLHAAWSEGTGHVGSPEAHGGTSYARWDGSSQ
jgi:hypothetical protein